jgi:hypothetical protein
VDLEIIANRGERLWMSWEKASVDAASVKLNTPGENLMLSEAVRAI